MRQEQKIMDNSLVEFLFKSLDTSSPSGDENAVTSLFCDFVSSFVDDVQTDVLGNCIAHKKGVGTKIMITAHADEVGLMVTYIDEHGYLYFKEIGGVDTNLLPGQRVRLVGNNGIVIGIIGKKPIHLQDKSDRGKELNSEDLWIDISAQDKADAQSQVCVGTVATFDSNPIKSSKSTVCSKSLDDKIGLAVLAGVALNLDEVNADVYLVATVQEELGARGAQVVSNVLDPEIGIAIDVTHATDYPTMSPSKDGDIKIGSGVVIPVGPNMNKLVSQQLIDIASRELIPYQLEAISRPTGTDAKMIQVSGKGIVTGLISIPCRYMHTPNEIVSLDDAESAIKLIVKYLKQL